MADEHEEIDDELLDNPKLQYGWGSFRPKCLACLNNHVSFAICASFLVFTQCLLVAGIWTVTLTTIEQRYGFSSMEMGAFGSIYDTSYALLGVIVSYFWHKNKPKYISIGTLILALGAVLVTLPHFIMGKYEGGVYKESDWCTPASVHAQNSTHVQNKGACSNSGPPWYVHFIFSVTFIVMGFGATPIWTLGPAHIKEVSPLKRSGIYLAFLYGSCSIGPSLGFFLASRILRIYVDIEQPANSNLSLGDRNFIGAWWLTYIAGACLLILPSLVMSGFPNRFPSTDKLIKEKESLEDNVSSDPELQNDLKSFIPATRQLLQNAPFIFLCLTGALLGLVLYGLGLFLPKFLETQFYIPAADSSLYTGMVSIPASVLGFLLSGAAVRRWSSVRSMFNLIIIIVIVSGAGSFAYLIGCDSREVVGVHVNYGKGDSPPVLDNPCRGTCPCSLSSYKPICTPDDGYTYVSPCHAGCSHLNSIKGSFYNCTCFPKGIHMATGDRCTPKCKLLPWFLLLQGLLFMITSTCIVPLIELSFRIVPDNQGSYCMGLQQFILRMLGFVPAPLVFGLLIDKSCILWGRDNCTGQRNSCFEYDNVKFRYYIVGATLVFHVAALILLVSARLLYRSPEKDEEEEVEMEPIVNAVTT